MKSEYISRPTAQRITGCYKEELIDLIEREVIEAYKKPDNSWAILRSSAEAFARVRYTVSDKMERNNSSTDEVSRPTAQKYIGCSKEEMVKLLEDGTIKAYKAENGGWRISKESLHKYLEEHK